MWTKKEKTQLIVKAIVFIVCSILSCIIFCLLYWLAGNDFPTERGSDLIQFIILNICFIWLGCCVGGIINVSAVEAIIDRIKFDE